MLEFFTGESAQWALFASAFASSTILPGASEAVLAAAVAADPEAVLKLMVTAGIGNTLGGATSYVLGRIFPKAEVKGRAGAWLEKYGAWSLLLSWMPLVGDALTVGAGWMRLNFWACMTALAAGKFARYAFVAYAAAAAAG